MNAGEPVGRVGAVWRYPVKSMRGERLARAEVAPAGIVGDRRYAVVDAATGMVASAKNPKKWGDLLACSARFDEAGRLLVALPDGPEVRADEPGVNAVLSVLLGRPVELRAAHDGGSIEVNWPGVPGLPLAGTDTEETLPAGSFHDLAPVHLLTTGTLRRLGVAHPAGCFEPGRFRPNLLVEPPLGTGGFVEDGWIGRVLAVGDEVRLKVTARSSRCVMTTLAQPGLPADPGVLRAVVVANAAHAGVYAEVIRPGEVREGDELRLEG